LITACSVPVHCVELFELIRHERSSSSSNASVLHSGYLCILCYCVSTLLCVCLSYEAMQCTEPSLSMQTTPLGNGCAIQHSSVPVPTQDKFRVLRQEWHLAYNGGDGGCGGTYDPNELTSRCIVSADASVSVTCFQQNWKYGRIWRSWYYSRPQFAT